MQVLPGHSPGRSKDTQFTERVNYMFQQIGRRGARASARAEPRASRHRQGPCPHVRRPPPPRRRTVGRPRRAREQGGTPRPRSRSLPAPAPPSTPFLVATPLRPPRASPGGAPRAGRGGRAPGGARGPEGHGALRVFQAPPGCRAGRGSASSIYEVRVCGGIEACEWERGWRVFGPVVGAMRAGDDRTAG